MISCRRYVMVGSARSLPLFDAVLACGASARLALLTQPWFLAALAQPSLLPSPWARLVLGAIAVVGFSFGVGCGGCD